MIGVHDGGNDGRVCTSRIVAIPKKEKMTRCTHNNGTFFTILRFIARTMATLSLSLSLSLSLGRERKQRAP